LTVNKLNFYFYLFFILENIKKIFYTKNNLVLSLLGICFFPTFAVLFEKSPRVMTFIIFALPRTLEGIWDLIHKLGFPLKFDDSANFIFALAIAAVLLMWKKYEKDFPTSYSKFLKFIYKD